MFNGGFVGGGSVSGIDGKKRCVLNFPEGGDVVAQISIGPAESGASLELTYCKDGQRTEETLSSIYTVTTRPVPDTGDLVVRFFSRSEDGKTDCLCINTRENGVIFSGRTEIKDRFS